MFPEEARKAILDDFTRSTTLEMHLVKANPAPADDDIVLGDLTAVEADYAGYAAQAIPDPGAATIDGADQGVATTATMTFQPAGLAAPQTIYGYWVDFTPRVGGAKKIFVWVRLLTPVVFVSDASKFQRILALYDQDYAP